MSRDAKQRLDQWLVELGYCTSRSQAQGMILAGEVLVDAKCIDKAGHLLTAVQAEQISLKSRQKYVSRGGYKLEKALETFPISIAKRVCLDVGASTGGFTDCLLQAGAAHVYAVDVGYGQIAHTLRDHPNVTVWERTHVNRLTPEQFSILPSVVVMDVSFISLKKVVPRILPLMDPQTTPWEMVCLIKPQFEYLDYIGTLKGFNGIVSQPTDHVLILKGVLTDISQLIGDIPCSGLTYSPLRGAKGNIEYLAYWRWGVNTPLEASETVLEIDPLIQTAFHAFEESNNPSVK